MSRTLLLVRLATLGLVIAVLVTVAGCQGNSALTRLSEARQLAADLLVQFTKGADAGNRAVMAETDDRSRGFVREAEQAIAAVRKDVETLTPLLRDLRYETETGLLDSFRTQFGEYQTLDRTILDLAVENTNVKAQQLSFGPARQAADDCRDALVALEAADRDQWRVTALAATVLADVREIQALYAPHIAEPDDAAMARMEEQMAKAETAARRALAELGPLVAATSRARLAEAGAALDRFMAVNKQIVALSRRNTDVRSLALSLNEKGKLTAACESTLRQLQEALAKRGLMGSR